MLRVDSWTMGGWAGNVRRSNNTWLKEGGGRRGVSKKNKYCSKRRPAKNKTKFNSYKTKYYSIYF